jgi:sugar lactone lactonase YvrE
MYESHIILHGGARPDDLTFDTKGNLLFSDFYNGTISRLNADGSVTVIRRNIAGPEGLVVLANGTMIIAEQRTNRILALAPGATTLAVLRTLPGIPSTAHCKDGVDGIAFDPASNTLIIPDSPVGTVYRLSLDGKHMTLLASGITRPVGAAIDERGNIFVADECGGALWRIAPNGARSRMGSFGMLDDVVLDHHGNILVTDLQPAIHALIRVNLATSKRETLYSAGLIEPQGLVIDNHDNIYLSDDYADVIVKFSPRA